jgi:hypothetical protein
VIGPGALPRPFGRFKKRTLAYTRPRRRRSQKTRAADARHRHTEIVIFDRHPSELPIATLVPRDTRSRWVALAAAVHAWVLGRWALLRPRMVPVIAAGLCTILVIASVDYLTHPHGAPIYGTVSCSIAHG